MCVVGDGGKIVVGFMDYWCWFFGDGVFIDWCVVFNDFIIVGDNIVSFY